MFPPVVLILLNEVLVRQRRSPLVMGGLLGLASAVQLLTGEEILATTVLTAAGGTVLLCILHPRQVAARVPRALAALAAAAVTFGILAAYPLTFQFFGPQRVSGVLQPPNTYVSDLLAFVAPPQAVQLSTQASIALTGGFTGNASENDAYVGIPLILLFTAGAVLRWGRPAVRWAALMTAGIALLSLGPQLHVAGRVTTVPLPWAVIGRLPLMESVLPGRLMLFAFLGIGIVLADVVDAAARASRRRTVLATGALVVALIPLFPRLPYVSTDARAPAFFEPGGGVAQVSPGSVVLVTPFSNSHSSDAMYWQATAGYGFRMPEGEVFVPGPTLGPSPSFLQTTLQGLDHGRAAWTAAEDRARALHELSAAGVTTIVAGPSPGQDRIVEYLTSLLGRPPVRTQGVDVWWDV
jgi:hypothetical protein